MAPQNYETLEQIARDLRAHLPVIPNHPFSLDCSRILEHLLERAGFHLKVVAVEDLPECAAYTIPDDSVIVFRQDIYDNLDMGHVYSRSTVVHELSHLVLRHAATLCRDAELGKHRFFEDSEWQAKALTAALMMPLEACQEATSPEAIAELCGTSIEAATYRLDRLRRYGALPAAA